MPIIVDVITPIVVGLHATQACIYVLLYSYLEYNQLLSYLHGIRERFRSATSATRDRAVADPIVAPAAGLVARSAADPLARAVFSLAIRSPAPSLV